jgi:hypothetical protein
LINGASSSGKSTLARALQAQLDEPFWHLSIDHLRESGVLPLDRVRAGDFAWKSMRPAFFQGFHNALPAIAAAGNCLIVDRIVETRAWMTSLLNLLGSFDVYFVGVHCPLVELERLNWREEIEELAKLDTISKRFTISLSTIWSSIRKCPPKAMRLQSSHHGSNATGPRPSNEWLQKVETF